MKSIALLSMECIRDNKSDKDVVPLTASCEVAGWVLWEIQNCKRSSAISGSNPWLMALLQKYVSQACGPLHSDQSFFSDTFEFPYLLKFL